MRVSSAVLLAAFLAGGVAGGGPALAQDAAQACREITGAPDAGAPVSREALSAYFSTMAKARPHCEAAVIGPEPDASALFHLAVIMQREGVHDRARDVFAMAAERGVAAAHTKLGDYYNFGIGGMPEDHARAVAAYREAIKGGDPVAKSTMAVMHQIGRGVRQDFEMTLALLQQSADAGYHFAQFRLAELYMSPQMMPAYLAEELDLPDPVKAAELYEKAAAQGSEDARAKLNDFYEGTGAFDDPAVRLKWIMQAADRGEAEAINQLGFLHETGDGVNYDPAKAAQLYVEALETGDLPVTSLRGKINGYTPPWDRETALEFQIILQDRGLYLGALDAMVGPGTLGAAQRLAQ
ncbi:MAG: tetratricopeptide repeat protein [Roseovarius sp.]